MFLPLVVAAVWVGLSGCTSVQVTPARLREAKVPQPEIENAMVRWRQAVELANAFLESPWRRTLPAGKFVLEDGGMVFRSEAGEWPAGVRVTAIGELCARMGFIAQERSDGFVVGWAPPRRDAAVDNTLFRHLNGKPASSRSIASLILHETTHGVFREGAVGLWPAVRYYGEAAFTWRYRTLTGERRAYATSEEFEAFIEYRRKDSTTQAEMLRQFEAHLAAGPTKGCRHGPFSSPPPPRRN
ncbi:MAG TPA: hypothetical protein VHO24_03800 [Opitutaceae bacterium]|nr:hypothetical protein [Opitutaceae bacterium]